jgi:hypothetical protein
MTVLSRHSRTRTRRRVTVDPALRGLRGIGIRSTTPASRYRTNGLQLQLVGPRPPSIVPSAGFPRKLETIARKLSGASAFALEAVGRHRLAVRRVGREVPPSTPFACGQRDASVRHSSME